MPTHDWPGLMLLVFILGLKHGMDPDHLATIDGLARFNAARRPRLARWSGFLFSLGHGAVVTLAACVVAAMAGARGGGWSAPAWLEDFGAWTSIVFLVALGGVNLRAVWRAVPGELVRTAGVKGRWLGGMARAGHPVVIAAVGAAFALSFDTLSQAAVFSLTASRLLGWIFAAALGIVFMLGMMVTDGVNGLWVARLLRRADRRALVVSRALGLAIGLLSLVIAAFGFARYSLGDFAAFADRAGWYMGAAVIAVLAVSYALATLMSRRQLA